MKIIASFFLLFLSFSLNAQDNTIWTADSLVGKFNVKKRYTYNTSISNGGHNIDYFNKAGNLIKTELISSITDQVLITTDYYYDGLGRLYASKTTPAGPRTAKAGFINALDEKYESLITYYEYYKDSKLKRKYYLDTLNKKIKYECLYSGDSTTMDNKWYDGNGNLVRERLDYFEKGRYIYKSELRKYDSASVIVKTEISSYANEYNSNGELIKSTFKGPECLSIRIFSYYDNGLLKEKKGDECAVNWKYKYKYY